jgi:molecular chaperone DnaK (HSP70)
MVIDEVVQEVADDTGYSLSAVKRSTLKINNVASKSFGVVAHDRQNREQVFNFILRNTTVPVDLERTFYTTAENQESVRIRVMESETNDRIVLPDNAIEIGAAVLHLPAGLPVDSPIKISFKLNEEGRLLITAIEATDSREVNVTIDTTSVIQGAELAEAKVRSQSLKVL